MNLLFLLSFAVVVSACPPSETKNDCIGGHFTCINISHSTCNECQNSYDVNNTCINHTHTHESACIGGVWTAGTNTTDSTCVECIGSYEINNICTSYSMYWPWQCVGGILALGTNTTDSTCTECVDSYEFNPNLNVCDPYSYSNPSCIGGQFIPGTNITDTQCLPCNGTTRESDDGFSCQPWSHPTNISCLGGIWAPGTNVVDSSCEECPYGKMEVNHNNICVDWQIHSFEACQAEHSRNIFVPGTNHSDAYCLECPNSTFPFLNQCVDCLTVKSLFRAQDCCHGMAPYETVSGRGKRTPTPYRDVCLDILNRWKFECDQTCNST